MQMQRWLLEFPATMRKSALSTDSPRALTAMAALSQHYRGKNSDERQAIYLSLSRTILEDLDKASHRRVENFLLDVGLLQKMKV